MDHSGEDGDSDGGGSHTVVPRSPQQAKQARHSGKMYSNVISMDNHWNITKTQILVRNTKFYCPVKKKKKEDNSAFTR